MSLTRLRPGGLTAGMLISGARKVLFSSLVLLAAVGPTVSLPSAPAVELPPGAAALSHTAGAPGPSAGCAILWSPPVDAPITDGYRPPATPYGPGNRGLEFGTESGDPVRAVAAGTVRFAGTVGGDRFVTVEQPSGLRATYGFVEQMLVTSGQDISQGQPVAVAGPGFHLTARVGNRYRDPTPLLEPTCYRVRLVPVPAGVVTGNG